MPDHNLKLVYDVRMIKNGYWASLSRSGIFFVALNILKELTKRKDVDLILFCEDADLHYITHVLSREIPSVDFQFKKNNAFLVFYGKLKLLKRLSSENKKYHKKILLQLFQLIVSPFFKLISFIVAKEKFKDCDVFLSPAYMIPKEVQTKRYTILYDLIFLKFPNFMLGKWKEGFWLYDLFQTLNGNDSYFAISEHTRKDFLEYFPQINPDRINTTLLACDDHFRMSLTYIEKIKEKYKIPKHKKYIFSLCTLEPRKNLQRMVKTFIKFLEKHNIKDMVFVLGGDYWKPFIAKMEDAIKNFGEHKDKIIRIGYVEDRDLPILYSGAEWFTYTSSYEGFGLPPLEAMSCGCPVITSNNSSLPEIVGDAGILIDWDSDEQHVEAYEKYYFDLQFRELNRAKGLARAKEFSWKKCVDKMIEQMKKEIF